MVIHMLRLLSWVLEANWTRRLVGQPVLPTRTHVAPVHIKTARTAYLLLITRTTQSFMVTLCTGNRSKVVIKLQCLHESMNKYIYIIYITE